jgi:hypothetical protein
MSGILEQIAAEIRDRVAIEFESVVRPKRINGDIHGDAKVTVVQGSRTKNEELSCAGNPPAMAYDQVFLILIESRLPEGSSTSADTDRNFLHDEFIKVMTDEPNWETWDGLAIDSDITAVEHEQDEQSSWVRIELLVKYRVAENDPEVVR